MSKFVVIVVQDSALAQWFQARTAMVMRIGGEAPGRRATLGLPRCSP